MGVVDELEQAVVPDDPVGSLGHEGSQEERGQLAVAVRSQQIVDVVQERGDHHLLVRAVAVGAGRALQGMFQPVDLVAADRTGQLAKVRQDSVRGVGSEIVLEAREQFVVLAGAVLHAGEADHGAARLRLASALVPAVRGMRVTLRFEEVRSGAPRRSVGPSEGHCQDRSGVRSVHRRPVTTDREDQPWVPRSAVSSRTATP